MLKSLVILFACFVLFCSGEIGYAGFEYQDNQDGMSDEIMEEIREFACSILLENGFIHDRSEVQNDWIQITEQYIYHITELGETKRYVPEYSRNQYGYPIPTGKSLRFAREYSVEIVLENITHELIIWKDIDDKVFCFSHRWNSRLDSVHDCDIKSIHPVCYNIWNLNDEWEIRANMIADEIIKSNADFVVLQEVRYNIIDEYAYKQMGKDRHRFQIDELKKYFKGNEWQYHYQPAMTYIDRFHTDEGLAIFSKFPIVEVSHLKLSRDLHDMEDAHQRIILRTVLDTPIGHVQVFNSHFALTVTARERAVVELWEWIQTFPEPHIFMGDLNAEPDDIAIEFLTGKKEINGITGDFKDAYIEFGNTLFEYTFQSWEPVKRIDFVLYRGFHSVLDFKLLGTSPKEIENREEPLWSSDHFGLSCILS